MRPRLLSARCSRRLLPIHPPMFVNRKDMKVMLVGEMSLSLRALPLAGGTMNRADGFLARIALYVAAVRMRHSAMKEAGSASVDPIAWGRGGVVNILAGQIESGRSSPLPASTPMMQLAPRRGRFSLHAFQNNHSPAPRNFSPVLSTVR